MEVSVTDEEVIAFIKENDLMTSEQLEEALEYQEQLVESLITMEKPAESKWGSLFIQIGVMLENEKNPPEDWRRAGL